MTPEQAARVCDRHFGVGADGVIFALPAPDPVAADYAMRIYNSDGSEPEMCGNGIRCLARFVDVCDAGAGPRRHRVDTLAGVIAPELLEGGLVRVDMGEPTLEAPRIPTTLQPTREVGPRGGKGRGGGPRGVGWRDAGGRRPDRARLSQSGGAGAAGPGTACKLASAGPNMPKRARDSALGNGNTASHLAATERSRCQADPDRRRQGLAVHVRQHGQPARRDIWTREWVGCEGEFAGYAQKLGGCTSRPRGRELDI